LFHDTTSIIPSEASIIASVLKIDLFGRTSSARFRECDLVWLFHGVYNDVDGPFDEMRVIDLKVCKCG